MGGAVATAFAGTAQAQEGSGTIGTEENPLAAIYVDDLFQNTNNISVGELEVNDYQIFVQPSEPSSPDDGDVWIDNSEGV